MVKQGSERQPSEPVDLVANNNDGKESVDSFEDYLRRRNNPSDDRGTFENMEKALRGVEVALQTNTIDRRSPSSDDSIRSDVGQFMEYNPNPVSRYSAGRRIKQTESDADRLAVATAKTHALLMGTGTGATLADSSTQDSPTRFDDEDYVANMVADVKRRRSKKRVQRTYWQTYDSEDREVDGQSAAMHIDDEMDNSTLTGTCYSEDEDEDDVLGALCGFFGEQHKMCLGNVKDEMRHQTTRKKRRAQKKKNRRKKRSVRGEGKHACEDATLEGTVISGYTREDTTLGGTVLSGYTRDDVTLEGTALSGYTRGDATTSDSTREVTLTTSGSTREDTTTSGSTEYTPPVLLEPNFLAEDDDGGENESLSEKAFSLIERVCSGSGSWFEGSEQSSQSEGAQRGDIKATGSSMVALSVKERLYRTKSQQSAIAMQNSEEYSNKSMPSSPLIRTPTQSELKAIYESTSRAEDDADTVEMSNQRQRNELNLAGRDESAKPTKATAAQKKKSLRHKLFSSMSKKTGLLKGTAPSIDVSSTPASPDRTVATGTSDTSIESQSREEDDDVCASYAALAITRTKSKVLISI
mmetsp:Transcript_21740/g.43527  ORF Transcript_21740/g.43527 Transcript_21740/m.43527 type:complete len:582 (+) Transcript_21740:49-1794(+)